MKNTKLSYTSLLVIHALIALAVFALPFLSKLYAFLIPVIGFIIVLRTKNKNNEVLFISAYLVGAEVFLRMTGGNFNNEYVKFLVIFFMFCGVLYSNFSLGSLIYIVFFIFLLPAVLVTFNEANIDIDIRKVIFFNLSGPVCLATCALYTYKRKFRLDHLKNMLIVMGMPIITTTVYLFLYTPSIKEVVTGTQSNFDTSGGFGPNQVSTILGLGIFVFFSQFIMFSKSKKEIFINGILVLFISFRAIVTFSRGGVISAVIMVVGLLILLYYFSNGKGKRKVGLVFALTIIMGLSIWTYSSLQTSGFINKRYANEDARGRVKKDRLGGREEIMNLEIKLFLDNPILGVGVGMSKYKRIHDMGAEVASHNEITRMLSEHGLFGIFDLLILFITPIILYFNNRQHLYFLSFYFFWFLTINHAAMRTAAPAFVYALTLLTVIIEIPKKEENVVL